MDELCSLRFVESGHNAVIMGPSAPARRSSPPPSNTPQCADASASTSNAATGSSNGCVLPGSTTATTPRCAACCESTCSSSTISPYKPSTPLDTADVYELIVERHRAAATVATSNREPIEWLGLMADALLAQSAIDRLQSAAHELVLDGESYRQRQRPTITDAAADHLDPKRARRSSRRRR